MQIHHILVITGLSLEIAGAFVLATEAIGFERLDAWAANMSRTRAEMKGDEPRQGSTFLDPLRFISGLASAGGATFGGLMMRRVWQWPSEIMELAVAAVVGGLVGAVLGVALYKSTIKALLLFVGIVRNLEARVRINAVGLLGFGLLFFGFTLQLTGTIVEGL